jgi:hypothetical protein
MEKELMEKVNKVLNDNNLNKSSKMKILYDMNEKELSVSKIAELMKVRYNFVYNVVSNKERMLGNKVRGSENKVSKKDMIIELIKKGKNNVEISAELLVCYNYVFGVRKDYELSLKLLNNK